MQEHILSNQRTQNKLKINFNVNLFSLYLSLVINWFKNHFNLKKCLYHYLQYVRM